MSTSASLRTLLLTLLALSGFAANSVLCRLALREGLADPAPFTAIRIVSGAVVLAVLMRTRGQRIGGDWQSASALTIYAVSFSFAYVSLPAGTGALLLFGAVQLTMIGTGLVRGERPHWNEWAGEAVSLFGLAALLAPGLSAPPLPGALLMIVAGVAWGAYSLRGRRSQDALAATAGNFLRAVPLALAVLLVDARTGITPGGALLAMLSGGLASGLGYAVWYRVLPALSAVRAGLVQLAVPVLVAAIGLLFLGEQASLQLAGCAALILGGLALATLYRPAMRR